jgi:hypothetical protein
MYKDTRDNTLWFVDHIYVLEPKYKLMPLDYNRPFRNETTEDFKKYYEFY